MTGQCRADGLIDPDAIPGANIKAEQVEGAGTAFSTSATDVRTRGAEVKTAWAKLGGSYSTPDSAELLSVMDGVETDSAYLSREIQDIGRADQGSIFLIRRGRGGVEHLQQVRVTNHVSHEAAARAGGLAD